MVPNLGTMRYRATMTSHQVRAGPSPWNRLPEDIRAEPDITNFRKLLKTHYFNSAFNIQ